MACDAALRLLLVDDHPLFHAGLAAVLSANRPGYALLSAPDAPAGLAVMEAEPVDLVLLDIMLPGCDGFEAVALYGQRRPDVPRVLISGREDPPTRLRASRSGASGYIAKSWPPAALLHVIDRVLEGGCCYEPPDGEGAEPGPAPPLTGRQLEVLELLAQGRSNKEIGRRLDIADRTVRAHLTEIFLALGVSSRVQAVLHAQRLGLVAA